MSLAAWAFLISCVSLAVAGASLGWQVHSARRARATVLELRFGRLPTPQGEEVVWCGIEVVNHSDFAVRVQDVQLIFTPAANPHAEPLIVGLSGGETGTIPGTVQPHDSGFISTGIPAFVDELAAGESVVFYANVITAVGNVSSPAYDVDALPWLPAPMRFERLWPGRLEDEGDESQERGA